MWTIRGLVCHLGMGREWFYHRIRQGFLREPVTAVVAKSEREAEAAISLLEVDLEDPFTIGERMSPEVEAALDHVVLRVQETVLGWQNGRCTRV